MKAVRIHAYGDENVLQYEEAPMPELRDDDVLIKVYAASVNPIDWQIREGTLRERLSHTLPLIPGWDLSGVIEELGPKVDNFDTGDYVLQNSCFGNGAKRNSRKQVIQGISGIRASFPK